MLRASHRNRDAHRPHQRPRYFPCRVTSPTSMLSVGASEPIPEAETISTRELAVLLVERSTQCL